MRAAQIDIAKNARWRKAEAMVVPFKFRDGGNVGLSPMATRRERYAVLVRADKYAASLAVQ